MDQVYRQLREAVISGEYAPGTPLRPDRLSRVYDVSLIPIREAIRKLEVERLVETAPNRGARVAHISGADLVDVYSTRIVLEVEALTRAWPHIDEAFINQLHELHGEMVRAHQQREPGRAHELHRRIHFALYERSGSPWLLHLIEILWSHTERYRRMVERVATFLDEGQDLHGHVIEALASGDLEEAAAALGRDLARTRDLILAANAEELQPPMPSSRGRGS